LPARRQNRHPRNAGWRGEIGDLPQAGLPKEARPPVEPPLAIVEPVRGALRLRFLDAAAEAMGLKIGMPLADARAMRPDLDVVEADTGAEATLLAAAADWARRFTPLSVLDGRDGLMLDVTGRTHLFGGEASLLSDAARRLGAAGFEVRGAIAPNPVAALALARGRPWTIAAADDVPDVLRPLPAGALGLPEDLCAGLARLGLTSVADLLDRPRGPLARRFGAELIERIDQALGTRARPIEPRRTPSPYVAERRFPEPIAHRDDVAGVAKALAGTLARMLERHGEGARLFELALFRADGGRIALEVGASRPLREAGAIADLLARRLDAAADSIDLGFGLDVIRLSVLEAGRLRDRQGDLTAPADTAEALAGLSDRIGARLGPARVRRLVPVPRHLPEYAAASVPAGVRADFEGTQLWRHAAAHGLPPLRPLRLLDVPEAIETLAVLPDGPPLRFRWRRALHEVASAEGPERIAPEWWRVPEGLTRDYFRVEDRIGGRFWLYRDGLQAREVALPRWYVHGVFA